jgi:hypothetical protein
MSYETAEFGFNLILSLGFLRPSVPADGEINPERQSPPTTRIMDLLPLRFDFNSFEHHTTPLALHDLELSAIYFTFTIARYTPY